MALNKQKALDAAQKFLQKGQIDKAILEFRKVCETDPEDLRSLQKLGDLYARQGQRQEAIATYMKLAEMLTARGFANRAVSIYKQILQLNPLLVPVYIKLSDLFRELGLSKDARIFNQRAIEILQKTGNQDDLLGLLRKIVEGDPEDAISRITLAETFLRLNNTASAVQELQAALPLLREQKLDDLFIRAAERLLYHYPDNIELCRELAVLHLRRNEVPRAMKLLLFCRKKDPEDVKAMELLAGHFIATGEINKASMVLAEKAKVHRKLGETDLLRETYRLMVQIDPDDSQARRVLSEMDPGAVEPATPRRGVEDEAEIPIFEDSIVGSRRSSVPTPASEAPPRPTPPPTSHSPRESREDMPPARSRPADADPVATRYIEEADIYLKYGLVDKATEHLRDGVDKTQGNPLLHERLKDIYLDQGDMEQAVAHLFQLAEVLSDTEPARAVLALKEILLVSPGKARAVSMLAALGESTLGPEARVEDVQELEAEDDQDDIESIPDIEPIDEEPVEEASDELRPLLPQPLVKPVADAAYSSFLDEETSDPGAHLPSIEEIEKLPPASALPHPVDVPEIGSIADLELLPDSEAEMSRALDSVTLPDLELEEIDALEKETEDIVSPIRAAGDLDVLDTETDEIDGPTVPDLFGHGDGHEALDLPTEPEPVQVAARVKPPAFSGPRSMPPPVPRSAPPPPPRAELDELFPTLTALPQPAAAARTAVAGPEPATSSTVVEDALEEAEFFVSQGLVQEAVLFLQDLLGQFPGNRLILDRIGELQGGQSTSSSPPAPFVTNEGLLEPLDSESQIADEAFDALSALESIIQEDGNGTAAVLGAQPTEIDASDARTHYDLGIAYQEMGVYESAIQEFRIASASPDMESICFNMIGNCLMSQGRVEDAIKEYKLGLFSRQKNQDQELNLYYDIAEAYIKLQDHREAVYYLQNIKKRDPGFKDVKLKLIALSSSYKPTTRAAAQPSPRVAQPVRKDPSEAAKEVDDAFDDLFGDFGGKKG